MNGFTTKHPKERHKGHQEYLSVLRVFFFLVLFVTNFLTPTALQAQPEVEASIAPKEVLIGAPATLTLQVKHQNDIVIYWPNIGTELVIDSARTVEVLGYTKIDTVLTGGYMQQSMAMEVTAWDTGFYIIPSFAFSYKSATDTAPISLQNYPVLLQVNTVPIDTTQGFRDIKAPIAVGFSIWEYKYWIFGGLGVLLLLTIILYLLLSRKKTVVEFIAPKPNKPPHQIAIEKLQQLDQAKLWQQGDIKGYYSTLSEIMREYLEARFLFPAVESTTHEIFASLDQTQLPPKQRDQLKEMFTLADLAKFAKVQPLPDDHFQAMQSAKEFVANTREPNNAEKDV